MRTLGLLAVALHASLLAPLQAQGPHKTAARDGAHTRSLQRFSLLDRSSSYHLPTYMMHLYRNFRANFSRPLDTMERDAARQADTVKSVVAKGLAYRHRRWIATFDLYALLADKRIQAAELRIRLPRTRSASNITVEVYHQQCHTHKSCQEQQLVGLLTESSLVTSSLSWKVFNMTTPLLSWLRQKSTARNRHKRVSRRRKVVKTKRGLSLPDQPVYVARREQDASDRALLVVFSHTGSDENSKARASLLHTAEQSKFLSPAEIKKARWPKKRRSKRGQREQTVRGLQAPKRGSEKSLCRRVDLHVDFNQIGWGSWIVFPKRYNAYRCEGSCPGPLGEDLNPTNHAYMQSLLKHYHPDRVAAPCCAPTKMSPLSMLYYESGEMLLRHHEDMIVDECGCQ
ncbi:nodal-related 2 [Acanthopagrus latus]|uniref:nodal-related 2 n=1 Tax=Acanthopagrus latus TaxID=8177 RepID=UPI00187CC5F1|nr:nodal-related 2 [Acanthopagrus latus]